MKIVIRSAMVALFLSGSLFLQKSNAITVIGVGYGETYEKAVDQARRDAVGKGIGTVIASETLVRNFKLFDDRILSRAQGFMRSYREISSFRGADSLYHVEIEAEVGALLDKLIKDQIAIDLLLQWMNKPRFMVLITEKSIGESGGKVCETEVNHILLEKGFTVVDPSRVGILHKDSRFKSSSYAADSLAGSLARDLHAEVLLFGQAEAELAAGINDLLGDLVSGQARVTARLFQVDTGELLASEQADGRAVHLNPDIACAEALKKAAAKMANQIIEFTLKTWNFRQINYQTFNLIIENVDFNRKSNIIDRFKECFPEIKAIHQRRFENDCLELAVDYTGKLESFGKLLHSLNFGSFQLRIESESSNTITVIAEP